MAVFLAWGLCGILTAYEVLPPGSPARTDTKGDLLQRTPWFYVPYPGEQAEERGRGKGMVEWLNWAACLC